MVGFFQSIQKHGFTAAKGTNSRIHQEITRTPSPQTPINPYKHNQALSAKKVPEKPNGSRKPSPLPKEQPPRKRRVATPQQRLESDSDDDGDAQDLEGDRKRARRHSDAEPDVKRKIRSRKAFSNEDGGRFDMVHAADIASLDKSAEFKPAFPSDPLATKICLQYPSASQPERYALVTPVQNDDFKALEDIREVMEIIISNYLPSSEAAMMQNDSTGLIRRLKRAVERLAGNEYIDHVQEWNETLVELRQTGALAKTIDEWRRVELRLLERILTQTYSRTVSPRVHMLRHYQNGTDNVYGELLPKFVSLILTKDIKMKSDQIFVDLGSGVGNCVLQAALEVGCESWGCEMMENACKLAELQQKEFAARCRLWGLSVGEMHLERGNFLENTNIIKILQKADVVLVNNQAFTPKLNEDLTNLFLDLKEGAKVVSLKSFVPHGHKISMKNLSAACNHLNVEKKDYYSACVSWTDAPGTYYISTKDSARVQAFAEKNP
ncbi:Nucleosomal histone H3-Lys79 methylase [Lecanora helva]